MHLVKILKLLAIFFLFISTCTFAQNEVVSEPEAECQRLMVEGVKAQNQGEYSTALEYLAKAEAVAQRHQFRDKLCNIKNSIGVIYNYLSNYGEALSYYKEVLEIAKGYPELEKRTPAVLNNIGNLHHGQKDYESALKYYKKAYDLSKKRQSIHVAPLAINIADVYNDSGNFVEAMKYLEEVRDIKKMARFDRIWKVNFSESLFLSGNTEKAKKNLEKLIIDADKADEECYLGIVKLLSQIHEKQQNLERAIYYAKKALDITGEIKEKIELFGLLANLYSKHKNYTLALQYKDSIVNAKDTLSARINRGLFITNSVKLKVQEYQNELETKSERNRNERIFFIIGILLALTIFYMIYRGLKHRIAKQKQEKINADNEKKIYELELDNLKNSVAEKNRKLSAKALYLSGRNELIDDVIISLSAIPEVSNKKVVSDYIKTLRAYIKTDEEWDDFITYFEQVNPEFIKTLTNKFTDLSTADIRFLCYVYMNLDVREIGNIYNITYNAAVKRLRRIREKMHINKDVSLHEYLVSLSG